MTNKTEEETFQDINTNIDKFFYTKVDKELENDLNKLLEVVTNETLDFTVRLEAVAKLQALLLKPLVKELTSLHINEDRIKAAEKTSAVLGHVLKTLELKKRNELRDEIDPNSPKFKLVFEWFIELINDTLVQMDTEELFRNQFFDHMGNRLTGWEEAIVKNLKGVQAKAMEKKNIQNPFLQEFHEKCKGDK